MRIDSISPTGTVGGHAATITRVPNGLGALTGVCLRARVIEDRPDAGWTHLHLNPDQFRAAVVALDLATDMADRVDTAEGTLAAIDADLIAHGVSDTAVPVAARVHNLLGSLERYRTRNADQAESLARAQGVAVDRANDLAAERERHDETRVRMDSLQVMLSAISDTLVGHGHGAEDLVQRVESAMRDLEEQRRTASNLFADLQTAREQARAATVQRDLALAQVTELLDQQVQAQSNAAAVVPLSDTYDEPQEPHQAVPLLGAIEVTRWGVMWERRGEGIARMAAETIRESDGSWVLYAKDHPDGAMARDLGAIGPEAAREFAVAAAEQTRAWCIASHDLRESTRDAMMALVEEG